MYRRKHNKSWKDHKPVSISFCGKADQADVECSCGYTERVATWFTKTAVDGFTNCELLTKAVETFLSCWFTMDQYGEPRYR